METVAVEKTWKPKADQTSVSIEALHSDIPDIVADLKDKTTELGKMARSNLFILKTRGFALSVLRSEYESQRLPKEEPSLDECFPIQCKFDIDHRLYMVVHTDRPAFKKGQLIP